MGVTYKPAFAEGKLALRFDVFNITNEQTATNIYPFSQLPDNTTNRYGTRSSPTRRHARAG